MNNMDTNYLLDLDFLLVVFCQEGSYSSLMSAFLHDTILPVNKGAFLRDGLNLDQSHYQNLWSLWFDTADWKSTDSGDKDWIWIKDPRWCRSWWINEFTRGRDSLVPLMILIPSFITTWSYSECTQSHFNDVFFFTDTEPCMEFSETLRRIVRSFDRAGQSRITVAYVKTSLHKKRFVRTDFHFCCIIVMSTLHMHSLLRGFVIF